MGDAHPAGDAVGGLDLSVDGVASWTIGMLADLAWVNMGLVPHPITGKLVREIEEARRAIDIVADLARHLRGNSAPQAQRELDTLLTNLRLNFVQQASKKDQG